MWILALLLAVDSAAVRTVTLAPAESVAVSHSGRGQPVVLVPGLFGSAYAFRDVAPQLVAAGYQAVIVEPLGIGRSSRPKDADYSLTAQARRLGAVLDTLGLRGAIVVAHSVAGAMVFRLAIERPDLVAGIVSIEGGPVEEAATPGFRLAMKFAPLLKMLGARDVIRDQVHRQLVSSSGDASWVTDTVIEGYTADAVRDLGATLDAFKGMARAREPWPLVPALGRIACPVRLVLGAAPHKSSPRLEEIEVLRTAIGAFAVDSVRGAGHFVFEEHSGVVVQTVEALRTVRSERSTP